MATTECIYSGGGGATIVPINNVTIPASAELEFATEKKARGIMVVSSAGDMFYADDSMVHPIVNGAESSTYTISFLDAKVDFGRSYDSSSAYTFNGKYWY